MSGEQWFVFTAAVGCFSFFLWEAIQLIRLRGKTGAADAVEQVITSLVFRAAVGLAASVILLLTGISL